MRINFVSFIIIFFLFSCSKQDQFPEKVSTKIPINDLELVSILNDAPLNKKEGNIDFTKLQLFVSLCELKDEHFDLESFETEWTTFSKYRKIKTWNDSDFQTWIEITGFLLELTGEARYGEELEHISQSASNGLRQFIAPYILTKKLDHIYVNLFQPVEFNYMHSMVGEVTFRQETDYPKSGSVKLHFGMTKRRHIELFIRIPSWAEGTTVTVKQVKYFAGPGIYCHIIKKWKEGDLVEIEFPMNLRPRHAELVSASDLKDSETSSE